MWKVFNDSYYIRISSTNTGSVIEIGAMRNFLFTGYLGYRWSRLTEARHITNVAVWLIGQFFYG